MNNRAYVLIFFFWAVLTVVTPTLILLSESSKADVDQNGKVSEGITKARKMMTYLEKHAKTPLSQQPLSKESDVALALALAPVPAPADAPAEEPASRTEKLSQN